MAISDTITSMYTNVGNAYNVLTLAGADLTNVDKNIVNLKPTWQERLLYFMNNGTQEVWNNWDKVNGSGTSLTLNNTEEAPMSLTYKGNTSQEGTPTPSSPQDIHVVSGDNSIEVCGKNLLKLNAKYTISGITFEPLENGKLSIYGTCTANIYFNFATAKLEANTSYNLNVSEASSGFLPYLNSSVSSGGNWVNIQTKNTTFQVGESKTYSIAYNITSGKTLNTVVEVQLEKGSTSTTYEAYQGSSYPISLGVENLAYISRIYSSDSRATLQYGEIKINGTYSGTGAISGYLNHNGGNETLNIKNGKTYTLSVFCKGTITGSTYKKIYFNVNGTTTDVGNLASNTTKTYTFTASSDYVVQYISFDFGANQTYDNFSIQVQLEEGSVAHSYTPYGSQVIELCKIGTYQDKIDKSTGKNLFSSGIEKGTLSNQGETSSSNSASRSIDYIEVQPNTIYTISNNMSYHIYTYEYDTNKSFIKYVGGNTSDYEGTYTITTTATTKYIKVRTNATLTENNTNCLWWLNKGSTSLPYEPYGTDWYLKKEIGKVVLNGSEEGWINEGGGAPFKLPLDNIYRNNTIAGLYSNYYIGVSYSSNWNTYNYLVSTNQATATIPGIKFRNTDITSLSDWKTWLSNNNTIVYYAMATPTYTKIEGTLKEQLETLKLSYEEQTNVSQTNNDLPFELDITALGEIA